jgi:hypothetical protein
MIQNQWISRLSSRERRVVAVGVVLTISILGYFLWLDPTLSRMQKLDRLIPQKEEQTTAFETQRAAYLALSQKVQQAERQMRGARSPMVFVEEVAGPLRGNIVYVRPLPTQATPPYQETSAEVKMENVRLTQVIPFLREVAQTSRIRRLAMKARFSDPSLLDVTFVVSSYRKQG